MYRIVTNICSMSGAKVQMKALGPCLLSLPTASYVLYQEVPHICENTSAYTSKLCLLFTSTNSGCLSIIWMKEYAYHRLRPPFLRKDLENRTLQDWKQPWGMSEPETFSTKVAGCWHIPLSRWTPSSVV